MPQELVTAILGVCFPPVAVFMKFKAGMEFIINLVLFLFLGGIAIFHCFHVLGVPPAVNICNVYIPPVGYYLGQSKVDLDFFIIFILWCLIWPLGTIWAYHKA